MNKKGSGPYEKKFFRGTERKNEGSPDLTLK